MGAPTLSSATTAAHVEPPSALERPSIPGVRARERRILRVQACGSGERVVRACRPHVSGRDYLAARTFLSLSPHGVNRHLALRLSAHRPCKCAARLKRCRLGFKRRAQGMQPCRGGARRSRARDESRGRPPTAVTEGGAASAARSLRCLFSLSGSSFWCTIGKTDNEFEARY